MIFFKKAQTKTKPLHHFILLEEAPIEPDSLRALLSERDRSYTGCDIHDLRTYPDKDSNQDGLAFDHIIAALIRLRFVSSEWVKRRKAVVILPFKRNKITDKALAQMRAVGLLGIIVSPNEADAHEAREFHSALHEAEILSLR